MNRSLQFSFVVPCLAFLAGFALTPLLESSTVSASCSPPGVHNASASVYENSQTHAFFVEGCCIADMEASEYYDGNPANLSFDENTLGSSFRWTNVTHASLSWSPYGSCEESPCDLASYLIAEIDGTTFSYGTYAEDHDTVGEDCPAWTPDRP